MYLVAVVGAPSTLTAGLPDADLVSSIAELVATGNDARRGCPDPGRSARPVRVQRDTRAWSPHRTAPSSRRARFALTFGPPLTA